MESIPPALPHDKLTATSNHAIAATASSDKSSLQTIISVPLIFGDAELSTFAALLDTMVPPIATSSASAQSVDAFPAYGRPDLTATCPQSLLALRATDVISANEAMTHLRKHSATPALRNFIAILKILTDERGMKLLSAGNFGRPYSALSTPDRVALMQAWRDSPSELCRSIFNQMNSLVSLLVYGNLLNRLSRDLIPAYPIDPPRPSCRVPPQPLRFLELPPQANVHLDYDVVVVGSGAGGGVAAAVLAQAGKRVLVCEKGVAHDVTSSGHGPSVSLREADAMSKLFERGGLCATSDGAMKLLAGATVGGGTAVNWSASLRPQHWLREEWASHPHHLEYFATERYRRALDAVCNRIGVNVEAVTHNKVNGVLREGCARLGYPWSIIPQNTKGHNHECGWCSYGCSMGIKQSSAATWLVDAQAAGADILQNCWVERVLVEDGKAVGVAARVGAQQVTARAPLVVSSCGALHSPALLLRSGLRNPNIGAHLGMHPVGAVLGTFDEPINPWEGPIMTVVSSVSEQEPDPTRGYYGSKLECPVLQPGLMSMFTTWRDPADHKLSVAKMQYTAPIVVFARDQQCLARIALDEDGQPDIHYAIARHDAESVAAGMVRAAKVLVAAGARELHTSQWRLPRYTVGSGRASGASPAVDEHDETTSSQFQSWLEEMRSLSIREHHGTLYSAHQMGSCRMGTNPAISAVSPVGETWEVKNLYVADASVFPTPSGVNPMVTTYSIGFSVAHFILEQELRRGSAADSRPHL